MRIGLLPTVRKRWLTMVACVALVGSAAPLNEQLRDAARHRDLPRVNLFIAAGADVNAVGESGRSALMMAASTDNLEVVRTLLAKGANVNARDTHGWTALMSAVVSREPEIVEELWVFA